MSIRNLKDGNKKPWMVECYPAGRDGKRIRKRFATKGEAAAFENFTMRQVDDKPWLGTKTDSRSMLELVERWYELYGRNLRDHKKRYAKAKLISNGIGNPLAVKVTANDFANYRQARLDGLIPDGSGRYQKIQPSTINVEQDLLASIFNELTRLGEWSHPNPIANFKKFTIDQSELNFLTSDEVKALIQFADASKSKDLGTVVRVCLATGCRWSEAAELKSSQISNGRITFIKTKGKKNRTVPISPKLMDRLPKTPGKLFHVSEKSFMTAMKQANIHYPGQSTHLMRHTFASHFMMNGGNILVLQRILGHADIKQTMVYAHFSPDHLQDAISKNPLNDEDY